MGYTERTETYWINARLEPFKNLRPSGYGPWATAPIGSPETLVAQIVGSSGDLTIHEGPKATPERIADSVLIHQGVNPRVIDNTLWNELPSELIEQIARTVEASTQRVARQWRQFSNEEAMTGALFSSVSSTIEFGNWVAHFDFIEFSKQTKETPTGADIAIIIDALSRDGMRRSLKTIWFQAKSSEHLPRNWKDLPRLSGQLMKMREYTPNSFGLVYTPQGAFLVGPDLPAHYPLDRAIRDAMSCKMGDKRASLLAQSLNRMRVFEILIDPKEALGADS